MKPAVKYWIFLSAIIFVVFSVIFLSFSGAWYSLSPEEQASIAKISEKLLPFPFVGGLILCAILSLLVSFLFHNYVIPILKLGESTQLISAVNPDHRIEIKQAAKEIHYLTDIINQSGEAFAKLQRDVDEQIADANRKLEEERTRLAALMSELPHGVIVCNTDGQILLYNQQAQQVLETDQQQNQEEVSGILGLSRSIFSILDRGPIIHALQMLQRCHQSGRKGLVNNFMTTLRSGLCLRVNMAPFFVEQEGAKHISGFVLTLEDMTAQIESDARRDMLIQSLTDDQHSALQEIRASITTILNQPNLTADQLHSYRQNIDEASRRLQEQITLARANYVSHMHSLQRTENVLGESLLEVISKNIYDRFFLGVTTQAADSIWLQLDSYSIVQAISQLVSTLLLNSEIQELLITLTLNEEQKAELVIAWPETYLDPQLLIDWKQTPFSSDSQGSLLTFSDLIKQMSGRIQPLSHASGACNGVLFEFPQWQEETHLAMPVELEHRPVSYEFNLFQQEDLQHLGELALEKLTYVVFDTETTGLHPSEGDEIIQIGAIRIVNGRMLYHEAIDQLVDPLRPVPQTSVEIHGIQPELLPGQPTIDKVLPHFHKFAENSVLVAHNAAFDMRFLQLKEESTGIKFENPVIDTLLLSSIIHPNQDSHSLEGLAERLNVTIVGRHTALGDAIVTAEVLLKMIPLLKANGINTLADALAASAKSPFAKYTY
ncbi:DNA polymerase-3 subunit epsilon [Malonomonas rubra DSM 5091]|uniref:DNA polymerase-3 subunit epsilon n=1 Tax=Malonomonas rubra DSM 5091 TaxID=1122189 RepID=A0A1M6C1J0_MALRU|nr:exonuclease domain-containing protein [Malonomonas rubra]SHI54879.1 DNA polymerase-3 subunit epsilon [Malonomonas rubra DSM 5091]